MVPHRAPGWNGLHHRGVSTGMRVLLLPVVVASLAGATAPAPGWIANVDVSRAPGPQAEVRIAADPAAPERLLAASNSEEAEMRVYRSPDGGRTWSSEILPGPPGSATAPCRSDPAPAFDASGTEYVAFIQSAQPCEQGGERVTIRLAVRAPGEEGWRYWGESAITEDARGSFDDNPWLAADTDPASPYRGRLYLPGSGRSRGDGSGSTSATATTAVRTGRSLALSATASSTPATRASRSGAAARSTPRGRTSRAGRSSSTARATAATRSARTCRFGCAGATWATARTGGRSRRSRSVASAPIRPCSPIPGAAAST